MWYDFKTEMPDPDPDNLVRLFDLRVDPTEEFDVKDFYPWVIGIMDGIVNVYEASLIKHPKVSASANAADPYLPPPAGSGSPVITYTRTDRAPLRDRSAALENPDFSGAWSTAVLHTVSVINRSDKTAVATLGSGWGDQIVIKQTADDVVVERVVFTPREFQPLVKYQFALDGSKTENPVNTGRTTKAPVSTTAWDENRLVITTLYPFQDPNNGRRHEQKVTQTLWLQPPTGTPWEPTMVVETTRAGVLGGLSSTNRTIYTRGYR
jgi:hypothetical protein